MTVEPLRWYSARVVLERLIGGAQEVSPLFEERMFLLRAKGDEEALQRAERLGRAGEETFENERGERIQWIFKEVLDIKAVLDDTLADGSEIYYAFYQRDELEQVRQALQTKLDPCCDPTLTDSYQAAPVTSGTR